MARVVLLGAPGSGKGTLAGDLTKAHDVPHISTGDMFRSHIERATPLGKKAKAFIDRGDLVPDEVTNDMLFDRLSKADAQAGFILDGFPRNALQAKALDEFLENNGYAIDRVVNILASEDIIVKRLSGRRMCSSCKASFNEVFMPPKKKGVCDVCGGPLVQRSDDRIETIQSRLKTYEATIRPLLDYYERQKKVVTVSNNDAYKKMLQAILNAL